jgi:hypothetical protein
MLMKLSFIFINEVSSKIDLKKITSLHTKYPSILLLVLITELCNLSLAEPMFDVISCHFAVPAVVTFNP